MIGEPIPAAFSLNTIAMHTDSRITAHWGRIAGHRGPMHYDSG